MAIGLRGTLYDSAGQPIKDGVVEVKVSGTKIVGESPLRKPVKAAKAVFYVRW